MYIYIYIYIYLYIYIIQAELSDCKTIIWNGPMGVFEMEKVNIFDTELNTFKPFYTPSKEPNIHSKEPYIHPKEPRGSLQDGKGQHSQRSPTNS